MDLFMQLLRIAMGSMQQSPSIPAHPPMEFIDRLTMEIIGWQLIPQQRCLLFSLLATKYLLMRVVVWLTQQIPVQAGLMRVQIFLDQMLLPFSVMNGSPDVPTK